MAQVGTRNKTSDGAFKKTEQVVAHPEVTDHNINDQYVLDPPNNLAEPIAPMKARGLKEGVQERAPLAEGAVLGDEDMGRRKAGEEESTMLQGNSVHPRSPAS